MSAEKLSYLIEEICAAVEIYFTGRTGGQYLKTSFILCDDYTELISKLFLLTNNRRWSDIKENCHFKNYQDVLDDVVDIFRAKRPLELIAIQDIHARMQDHRSRRNDFFHSTHLLDLSVGPRIVVESFCDLFAYGKLLFGSDWQKHVNSSRNLDTMRILLLIEKESFRDPTIWQKVQEILRNWPRNKAHAARKGVHLTEYPEDFHLRLCVTHGSNLLRDKLKAILPS
jgi:hypothetical protein